MLASAVGCGGDGNSSGSGGTSSSSTTTTSGGGGEGGASSSSTTGSGGSGGMAPCVGLDFDGAKGIVSAKHITLTQFTLEAWIKPDAMMTGQRAIVTQLNSKSFNNFELGVENGKVYLIVPDGSTFPQVEEMTPLEMGKWYHIAGMYDGMNGWVTVNGVKGMDTLKSSFKETDEPLSIGARPSDGFFFDGIIAEVRISSKALYTQDFKPEPGFTKDADTVALWSMDENMGMTTADSSDNKNDATIMAGVTWVQDCPPHVQ